MGGTKNRPCPTAKLPPAIQERRPPPSNSSSPTASPTAGAGVPPIAKDGPTKPRREGRPVRQTRCDTSFGLLAVTIAGLAVLALLLTSASVGSGGQHTRPSQKEMPFALHFAREQASIGAGPRPARMSPWRPCLLHARCGAFSWFSGLYPAFGRAGVL
jgi:hypothetical protein